MRYTLASLLLLFGIVAGCAQSTSTGAANDTSNPLTVYCAAGIRLPVEEAAKQYQVEFGRKVQIDYGSSGELEGRLEIDRRSKKTRCDLYIPADRSFAKRCEEKGLTAESIQLAEFRLVLATKAEETHQFQTVADLLDSKLSYVVCDTKAGVGKKTMTTLQASNNWAAVDKNKKVSFPRVPEAANAIKTSSDIAAGFIWDTTAQQFGLRSIVLDEIKNAVSSISVNVVTTTQRPSEAIHFARYLAAQDKGQQTFPKYGFKPSGTDYWDDRPELVLYCGGVNRNAVDKTLREFEKREGVVIKEQYGGCGTLVTGINSIAGGDSKKGMPDAFMTCDVSYMDKVQNHFEMPMDVSSTNVVMLVRKGNPKQIVSLPDLAKPDIAIGTTNPKMSTLGDISWQLFESAGIKDKVESQKSVMVLTPTAHELIMQMTGHDKLDVALVYEANCQNLSDQFELVPIDHERARAIQNIATARETRYPALARRLTRAITSAISQQRFEQQGFQWRVQATAP